MLTSKISYFDTKLQQRLFPLLEEHYENELLESHMRVLKTLEIVQIENYMPQYFPFQRGRPPKHPKKIARAFIAKHVLNINTTSELIHRLQIDKQLRYICGWSPGEKLPDESLFSRVFAEISERKIPQQIHEKLSSDVFEDHLVLHCARDSCPVPSRERATKREKSSDKYKSAPRYLSKRWREGSKNNTLGAARNKTIKVSF